MKVKLFYKIFLAFLAVALLPALFGNMVFTTILKGHLQKSIRKEEQISLQKSAFHISNTLSQFNKTFETTANYLLLTDEDKQTLQWIYRLHPEIDKLVEVDMTGTVINSNSRYEHIPIGSKFVGCKPEDLKGRIFTFQDWSNEPHICIRNPISSLIDGKQRGALYAHLNIHSLFETIIFNKNNQHTQFIVNANNGKVVFHPDFNFVLSGQKATNLPVIDQLEQQSEFAYAIYQSFQGIKVVGAAVSIPGTPLYVIDEIPYLQAYSLLTQYEQLVNRSTWLRVLLILFFAFLFARSITRPIRNLLAATTKIEKGDLDALVNKPKNLFPDEISTFRNHFRKMVDALKRDRLKRDEAVNLELATREKLYQAQKMEAIGLLTGGAAHDLNNILSGIIGYPELILRKLPQNSPLQKPVEAIKQSGLRASSIVADLLTVSRGIAAPRELSNLNQIIGEYFNSLEWETLHKHHPSIICNQELCLELLNINCSTIHIKKSLMNLIINAMEVTDTSGVITISTRNQVITTEWAQKKQIKPGDYAVLSVADTGSGISEKDLQKIFEPFYTKKEMGRSGTGLGLTIVANTVRDHNGCITVESNELGTIFELFFPATKKDLIIPSGTQVMPERLQGKGEHILVVDDVELQRDLTKQMLDELGYNVDVVASGENALKFLQKNPVDLIILDMIMDPGMGGRETYQHIIANWPGQKAIIASGYIGSEEVEKTLALGADAFIKKPYDIETIARAVHESLIKNA